MNPSSSAAHVHSIEPLETRIAPAMASLAIVNPLTATYTDVDGDQVTVKVSTGTLTAGLFTGMAVAAGDQLQLLDLSAGGFDGANLSFSVAKVPGGDGLVNVGRINSSGHDLGKVTVKGDLGRIDAGDAVTLNDPGVIALTVRSLGRAGTDTQVAGGNLQSNIVGALGALAVAGDVKEVTVLVSGGGDGRIGAITIGGSLLGGDSIFSGLIQSEGDMGAVKIGQDLQGGSGSSAGRISSLGKLASVTIGGSLIGGSSGNTGEIFSSGDLGAVKIGHDLHGSTGGASGSIMVNGKIASVSIGGSLLGGPVDGSGTITSAGDIGAVKIGHDLTGGSIAGTDSLDSSGVIQSTGGRIASVSIGGSIISGIDNSTGALTGNATIRAGNDLGSLKVKGSLVGHGDTGMGASPVIISARGQALPSATTNLAIGKVSIGGRVEFATFLAGYSTTLGAVNGDAQIGAVKVGGDWVASNLVAGARNLGADNAAGGSGVNADNVNFGNGIDVLIGGGGGVIASIASITIKGQLYGTPDSTSTMDHYGFVAERLGALKIGGLAILLTPGAHNDNFSFLQTGDINVHEI